MQTFKKPYLTIIVPAYNVEQYIEQCLDSLIHQTEMNHKILVVNDGSTDGTPQILHRYAKEYPNLIQVIDQENKGLGAARNRGLQDVDTPFVTFLDSDDWQTPQFVERTRMVLERQDEVPDIVFTLPWNFDSGCKSICPWKDKDLLDAIFFSNPARDGESVIVNRKSDRSLYALEPSTNRRIYRTAFLNRIGLQFTEGRKWEDVVPHFKAIHNAERCIAIRDVGFFYRINTGSQITSGGGASRLDVIPVYKEILDFAAEDQWSDEEIAYIIRMMLDFCKWSVDVTNTEYIIPLLQKLHDFYKTIPYRYFKAYLAICPMNYRRDWLFFKILRGPFYRKMKDYRVRALGVSVFWKLKRILRRG